ncbi:MAG: type II secretion system F family protein [Planctomycetales bacterium]
MNPNLTTWIFLAAALLLALFSLFRKWRRNRPANVVRSRSMETSRQPEQLAPAADEMVFVDSLQESHTPAETVAIHEPALVSAPAEPMTETVPGEAWGAMPRPVSIPRKGTNGYARRTTFESLAPSGKEDRLPRIEPGDIPLSGTGDYVLGGVTPVLSAMLPESSQRQQETKKELLLAGFYQPHALQNLNAVRYFLIILSLLVFGTLFAIAPPRAEMPILGIMVAFAIMGWALPRLYVRGKAAERKSQIERALPDVLDMLNMCVSQGMIPLTAMERVTAELGDVYPDLTQELRIVAEQAKIGTMAQALENMKERLEIPEVHSFTNLLLQTERMGTSVSAALAEYAERMRESLRQRADQKANQASFKLLFPTVLCLMPAVYMFLLGPSIIELSDFFNGRNQTVNNANQAFQRYNENRSAVLNNGVGN